MNILFVHFFIKYLLVYNIIHYLCCVQSVKFFGKGELCESLHALLFINNKTNNR